MTRSDCLQAADAIIHGPRQADYGNPQENMTRIAQLWGPILGHAISPEQVALCLLQLKIARLCTSPSHRDSWVDAAGYLAIGAECATHRIRNREEA